MDIQELREKLGGVVDKMRAMLDLADTEDRDLTEDETKTYDGFTDKTKSIKASIQREEDLKALQGPLPRKTKPNDLGVKPVIVTSHYRHNKLRAFKTCAETGRSGEQKAYDAGKFIHAALFGSEKAAQYCRDNGIQIRAAAGGDVNTKGGVLVPDEFDQTIIDLRETYGIARQECKISPMAGGTKSTPRRTGGLTAYFVDENPASAITESDKSWDNVTLTAKKLAILTRMSNEIEEDSIISMADDLAKEIAYAFAVKEDSCLFDGDGTSTYGGMHGIRPKIIDGTHTAGAVDVATNTHNLFTEIDATDIAKLMAALPRYALSTAKFYCSQAAFSMIFERLVQAAGGNTINDLAAGYQFRYMGYPVVISQTLPAGIATDYNNVAMFLFGNISMAATLGNRRGTTIAVSNDRYFDTDQIGIRGTERFDINVHELGDNSNAGPLVAMIGSSS